MDFGNLRALRKSVRIKGGPAGRSQSQLPEGKPVVAGFSGGLSQQVIYDVTGFTVNSVEGAAFRARQLLADPELRTRLGAAGREHVRQNFLITRQLGDELALMATLLR